MTDFKELRGAPLVEAVLQGDLVAELKMQAIVFQKSGAERMALLLNRALDRLEAAERDARRYRWLHENRSKYVWNHVLHSDEKRNAECIDDAIDAAMKEQQP